MEFPKWKGTLNSVLASVGSVLKATKVFILGATFAFNPSGQGTGVVAPQADVSNSIQSIVQISRYSKKVFF